MAVAGSVRSRSWHDERREDLDVDRQLQLGGSADDTGSSQQATDTSGAWRSGPRHEFRSGERNEAQAREDRQDGADDGRCGAGEDQQHLPHDAPLQQAMAGAQPLRERAGENPKDNPIEADHRSGDKHQALSADNKERGGSTQARDGAGEEHKGNAAEPEQRTHDAKNGWQQAQSEPDSNGSHDRGGDLAAIIWGDTLAWKDISESPGGAKPVAADEAHVPGLSRLSENQEADKGASDHGAHAHDHAFDTTLENLCPPASTDHALFIL